MKVAFGSICNEVETSHFVIVPVSIWLLPVELHNLSTSKSTPQSVWETWSFCKYFISIKPQISFCPSKLIEITECKSFWPSSISFFFILTNIDQLEPKHLSALNLCTTLRIEITAYVDWIMGGVRQNPDPLEAPKYLPHWEGTDDANGLSGGEGGDDWSRCYHYCPKYVHPGFRECIIAGRRERLEGAPCLVGGSRFPR